MFNNRVVICGVDTGSLPVLREKEKTELLARVKAGDKKAREELVNGNLRLVLSVVQRFSSRGENPDDLFQIAGNFTDVLRQRFLPFVIAAAGRTGRGTHHNCSPLSFFASLIEGGGTRMRDGGIVTRAVFRAFTSREEQATHTPSVFAKGEMEP